MIILALEPYSTVGFPRRLEGSSRPKLQENQLKYTG
jgi:hypothetical protein